MESINQNDESIATAFRTLFFLSESEIDQYHHKIHLLWERFLQVPGFEETHESHRILDTIMRGLSSLKDFFQYNQSNIIATIETLEDPRISLTKGVGAEIEARFINMLHIRHHALHYQKLFPDAARDSTWWDKLENPGYRSTSRVPAYAKINNFPLEATRKALKVGLKMLAIEGLVPGPGVVLVLIPVWNNLAGISYPTAKRLCEVMVDGYEDIMHVIRYLSRDVDLYQRIYERHLGMCH